MDPKAHNKAAQRADYVRQILRSCELCPRRCSVDRLAGQTGYCGLDAQDRFFLQLLFDG